MVVLFIRLFPKAVRKLSKSKMKNKRVAFLTTREIYTKNFQKFID